MAETKNPTATQLVCCNCKRAVGIESKIVPCTAHDGDGTTKYGDAKMETWCPRCWVGIRQARDPDRFHHSRVAAVCGACDVEQLAVLTHSKDCPHCRRIRVLSEVPEALIAVVGRLPAPLAPTA